MESILKNSNNFFYREWCVSSNYPEIASKMELTDLDKLKIYYHTKTILQPCRDYIKKPIFLDSGKRVKELNTLVGGVEFSDHLFRGESCACDIRCQLPENTMHVFMYIKTFLFRNIGQVILYYTNDVVNFIHVSLPTDKHFKEILVTRDKKTFIKHI